MSLYIARNLDANKEVRFLVLICGTNYFNKNVTEDIVKGVKYAIQLIKCEFYNSKVIVLGILPRDFSPDIRRDKIRSVNFQIKDVVEEINNFRYIGAGHIPTT